MIENRDVLSRTSARVLALECLEAGLEAADPLRIVAETVSIDGDRLAIDDSSYDLDAFDEVLVVGGGKAAGRLASALETVLGDHIDGGLVVTDTPVETERVDLLPGDHPVPSERSVESTERIIELVSEAGEGTLVLAVVTGGGSALLTAPAPGVPLSALRAVTNALVEGGATIHEFNAVRKHLSSVKGGQLALEAAPATVVSVVISDVVGNDPGTIASGPTVPDGSTFVDAVSVLERHEVEVPPSVEYRLERGVRGSIDETPGADHPAFDRSHTHVLADGLTPLVAAAGVAREFGFEPVVLSSRIRGEAREVAKTHVAIAEEARASGNPISPSAVLISGGETTVRVRGDGIGGPNQEFALSAALELEPGITVAAIDSDGVDGASDAAGALVDASTVDDDDRDRAWAALDDNDAHSYLSGRSDTIETGPTGTNVNDVRVVVVDVDGPALSGEAGRDEP